MIFIHRYNIIFYSFLVLWMCNVSLVLTSKNFNPVIEDITDIKDFKKLLRTKNNVLVAFTSSQKKSSSILKVFRDAANSVKGEGSMVIIDCSGEAKKLCRKLKVAPEPYILKHYKDGEFNKDYDRKETVPAMLNFMRDPTGDMPWDEDDEAADIHHVPNLPALAKLIRKQNLPMMVMFYAPWCGFCKKMKPDYSAAAAELKGKAIMAAIDVNRPENAAARTVYNISGFPTLIYFENGAQKMIYEGENKKEKLIDFMKDPSAVPVKEKEEAWSDGENDVTHLTDANFDSTLASASSALVMFYAPWCGHCKRMKPNYEKAATKLKASGGGLIAALDATVEREVAKRFEIKGYPTVKYFVNGEFKFDVRVREEAEILNFMKDPKEPPPPPPPETPWAEQQSEVIHLTVDNFKPTLKKKKHALVMFYAPWCGHCKKAKPEYTLAADQLKEDPRVALTAIDCTSHSTLCSMYDVSGYPTIKLFHYLNKQPPLDYEGGRTAVDFLKYMVPYTSLDLSTLGGSTENWQPEGVVILDDKNAESIMKSHKSLLVFFYAPWCIACQRVKDKYVAAAKILSEAGVEGKLAVLDITKNMETADKHSIVGLPTFKYYESGNFVTFYHGERATEGFVEFMKNPVKVAPVKPKDEL